MTTYLVYQPRGFFRWSSRSTYFLSAKVPVFFEGSKGRVLFRSWWRHKVFSRSFPQLFCKHRSNSFTFFSFYINFCHRLFLRTYYFRFFSHLSSHLFVIFWGHLPENFFVNSQVHAYSNWSALYHLLWSLNANHNAPIHLICSHLSNFFTLDVCHEASYKNVIMKAFGFYFDSESGISKCVIFK